MHRTGIRHSSELGHERAFAVARNKVRNAALKHFEITLEHNRPPSGNSSTLEQ